MTNHLDSENEIEYLLEIIKKDFSKSYRRTKSNLRTLKEENDIKAFCFIVLQYHHLKYKYAMLHLQNKNIQSNVINVSGIADHIKSFYSFNN